MRREHKTHTTEDWQNSPRGGGVGALEAMAGGPSWPLQPEPTNPPKKIPWGNYGVSGALRG